MAHDSSPFAAIELHADEIRFIEDRFEMSEELAECFALAQKKGKKSRVQLGEADLDELLNGIEEMMEDAGDKKTRQQARRIYDAIAAQAPAEGFWPEDFDEEDVGRDLEDALAEEGFSLHDAGMTAAFLAMLPPEAQTIVAELPAGDDDTEDASLDALEVFAPLIERRFPGHAPYTFGSFLSLVRANWTLPGGPVYLDAGLAPEALAEIPLLHNARAVLEVLDEGVACDGDGNLPPAFLRAAAARMQHADPDYAAEAIKSEDLVEEDIDGLGLVLDLLETAELIAYTGEDDVVQRTERGREAAAPERAGALYAALFGAALRHAPLELWDEDDPWHALDHCTAHALCALRRMPAKPMSPMELMKAVLPPVVIELTPPESHGPRGEASPTRARDLFLSRVLYPLRDFGLLAIEGDPERPAALRACKTPLFDRFLAFDDLP